MTQTVRLKWLRAGTHWAYRVTAWSCLAVVLLLASVVIALRYWVLPNVENYRDDIAGIVSEKARQKITIGSIRANWDGLRPQLMLEQVTVHDAAGRPALVLSRVDNTLSWLSVPMLQLRFHALDIYSPTLSVRRDAKGVLSVAGIEMPGEATGGGFADWLLRQRHVQIHDATITWHDELRRAPPLELKNVNLQIANRGERHQFGLRAVPPAKLAAPLDVRGDLTGNSVKALAEWNGKLYLALDYADIAAWRTWVPFPIEFPRGSGALRAWLTFSNHELSEAVADLRLANVRARLEKNLPELDLAELSGRLGWKMSSAGYEITTSALKLTSTGGHSLPPTNFLLRFKPAPGGGTTRGELSVNALDFAPLAALADHLPFPADARQQLAQLAPKGHVSDVQVRWTGDWRDPGQFSAKGRFSGLALNGLGRIPGFKGVNGSLEGNERGGTLQLNTQNATVDMPLVFRETLQFDVLTAQLGWARSGVETEFRLNNISFSNSHVAGNVAGNYRTAGDSRGEIDLTGTLTRADARSVSRYIPLQIGPRARRWLDVAFVSGQSSDVTVRVKGNLNEFPFADGQTGVFQVTAKVVDGTLDYAEGWPRIENIAGDFMFRGARMEVHARQGTILNARLSNVRAEIPNLKDLEEVLTVTGEADAQTADFFAFVEKTPILGMIDHFTESWQVQGAGKLVLKLDIPLRAPEKTQVAGTYQFSGNTVLADADFPAIEQASGRIDFTDSSVRTQGITGTFAGGPVTISATTQRDAGVRIAVHGRVNTDNIRRAGTAAQSWLQGVRGATDWRAAYTVQKRVADFTIESSLQGLVVELPAPIVKSAADAALPLKFERRSLGQNQERLSIAFGDVVSAQLLRRVEAKRAVITRGTVRFGGVAAEPEKPGVWVSGTVKALDLDRWIALMREGGGDARVDWGGIELKADAVDLFGRRFNQVALNAALQGGQWRSTVAGKELDGTATWDPQGKGKLVARMKTVSLPNLAQDTAANPAVKPLAKHRELPAVDLIAEQFVKNGRELGRLELTANPTPDSWRIDKLKITNPDGSFTADGFWQTAAVEPRTQLSLRLDTPDGGKLLARLGYPQGLKGGRARLEGALAWSGAPYDFDYPSLSGGLLVEVQRGQFTKLDPGIGKLLGIVSLQSLPRRISLDFRDIFSEGLAFDDIVGAVKIDRGIMSTDSFRIQGPSARIVMAGDVDLARETQKLRVRVSPSVSDGVSIAGALIGGPIAGVAAFLAQKILKDPLNEMAAHEYAVTGTWAEPTVMRIEGRAAAPAPDSTRSQ